MKEEVVHIGCHDVHALVERRGEEWIVCLHGIQSCKDVFIELLSKPLFQNYSLLALDFVGFGNSSKPRDFSYDMQDQANVVSQLLTNLKIEKCHIIGHSMGGMVGTLLLSQLGAKVLSLINMEGNLTLQDCGSSFMSLQQSFEEFSSGGYEKFKQDQAKSIDAGTEKRMQWLSMIPDYVFFGAAKSIVNWSKSEKLLPLFLDAPQRKLYVYGEKNAAKGERLPSALLKAEIPHAGHRMLTDNLEGTYREIEKFMTASDYHSE